MFKQKSEKLRNTIALKRNIYAVVLSVIFIAAVIALTVVSTILAERYPLDIDLTTNRQHSISDENFEYISSVDEKINIYVAATQEAYNCATGTSDDIAYVAAETYFVNYSKDNAQYYVQTVELLKKYANYNKNITVRFIDPNDAKNREITDEFSGFTWAVGDILVESRIKIDGKDSVRRTVVPFIETYTREDLSGMAQEVSENYYYQMMGYTAFNGYGFYITENKIESVISSAIYKVTSPDTPVFLVPTAVSDAASIEKVLENTLGINNFVVEYNSGILSSILTEESFGKYDGIILSDCRADITADERTQIEKFLDNGGKKGKALVYFAGTNAAKLTNLCGLLGAWGIGFGEGILYETDKNFHSADKPTSMAVSSAKTEITAKTDVLGRFYGSDNLVPMKQLWEDNSDATYVRDTELLLYTSSYGKTVVMPAGQDYKTWTVPEGASKDSFPVGILCEDSKVIDNQFYNSYVVSFASSDFISDTWNTASFANMNIVVDVFNYITGNADAAFSFVPKKIEVQSYYANVTDSKVTTMKIIFMAVVPVSLVGVSLFVWIRRKRK